ncbi:hypothetical protein AWN76_015660 [Rhodothermaceae bacterium RA]|nr:hypothetical protein AWN76_015660 [Rhodothermaceae bacterium RA]
MDDQRTEEQQSDAQRREEGRLLANKAFLLAVSKILATVFNVVLFTVLSYRFSPEAYGQFRQVWLINRALALEIFTLGIPLSIFYFLPRLEPRQRLPFVLQSVGILAGVGLLVTAGVFMFAGEIARLFNSPGLAALLRLFCLFPLLTLPTLVAEGVLVSLDRARDFALFTIFERVLSFVAAVGALVLFDSVAAVLWAILMAAVVRLGAAWWLVRRALRGLPWGERPVSLARQIRFGLPVGAANVVNILNVEIDKLVISVYFSVAQFARYTNGAFDIPVVGTVAGALNSVLMPEFARAHQEDHVDDVVGLWNGAITRSALLFVPLMGFLFFFAEDLITLVFSNKYAESAVIFQIYLVAMIPKIVWFGPILVALGYPREPLVGASIALVSNVVLNVVLIRWVGFTGPAWATVITTFVLVGYYMMRLKMVLGLSLRDVFPWRQVGQMLVLSVGVGGLVYLGLGPLEAPNYVRLALGGLLFYALALPLLWRARLLGPDEVNYLLEYARKLIRLARATREARRR